MIVVTAGLPLTQGSTNILRVGPLRRNPSVIMSDPE